ncbi:MAG: class I SAM-dependent methyltransferase [Bacteroidia bacterium]
MFDFHRDVQRYVAMQEAVTNDYILPFLRPLIPRDKPLYVLEVGCGEAGVLKAFLDKGHYSVGVELSSSRAQKAKALLQGYIEAQRLRILNKDIFEVAQDEVPRFDLILLKDVIEHLPHKEKFMMKLKQLLTEKGIVFFAYFPRTAPYHQRTFRDPTNFASCGNHASAHREKGFSNSARKVLAYQSNISI